MKIIYRKNFKEAKVGFLMFFTGLDGALMVLI